MPMAPISLPRCDHILECLEPATLSTSTTCERRGDQAAIELLRGFEGRFDNRLHLTPEEVRADNVRFLVRQGPSLQPPFESFRVLPLNLLIPGAGSPPASHISKVTWLNETRDAKGKALTRQQPHRGRPLPVERVGAKPLAPSCQCVVVLPDSGTDWQQGACNIPSSSAPACTFPREWRRPES